MTELLYMKDCYVKQFDASVIESEEGYVVLDQTAFYPEGGGQPSDTGFIKFAGKDYVVNKVKKEEGKIKHYIDDSIPMDSIIEGVLDWDKRYNTMRMHTAQHLLSAIILDEYGAETVGNQIYDDHSRMDLKPLSLDEEKINNISKKFNQAVDKQAEVELYITTREEVYKTIDERRRKLFERVPSFVKDIRIVDIKGMDKCPCAGTHVKNTSELGYIKINKTENKGKDTVRLDYSLVSK